KTGAIFVLDSYTGAPRVPLLDVDEPVTWLGVQNQNILWYTTPNRVVSRSLLDNSQRWQRVIPGESIPGENGLDGGVLMLRTKNGRLRALDASTGREMGPFTPLPSELGLASTMEPIDDQWHLFGPKSAMALARDGQILWVDAIADADKRLVAQLVGARYVVVINQIEPMTQPARGFGRGLRKINPPNPVNRWVYRLYLLDRRHGMIRWQRDLPPLPGPLQAEDAMFLDNRLVLPTESFTVLIPGSGAQSPAD
ncbi:MAG: hypothetical protein QGH33_02195, partial [Pirellulaceae bacterium]|nr:hypothetical protein [Pirellulaceae bacterium]